MNTAEVKAALSKKFAAPEFAMLFEVRNGTGYQRSLRTADALAMSLWPSRGLELNGFEIKVSRSDWLKELNTAAKAEAFHPYCDRWWLVVGDRAIVRDGELPRGWGLLAPRGDALTIVTQAELNPEPKPVDRLLLAAIMRKVSEGGIDKKELELAENRGYTRGQEEKERSLRHTMEYEAEQLTSLREAVREFEEKSGVKIIRFHAGRIGDAVKVVMDGGIDRHRNRLEGMLREIENISSALRGSLELSIEENQS